jgi:ectoine hydroxylase-related dioxygenase (phytanoyl-CoA dioxygenase family)
MFFSPKARLAQSADQLSRTVGRPVPLPVIESIVDSHPRPRSFARILGGVLAFEANPRDYARAHPAREQQKWNHRCDYDGSLRVSAALSRYFDFYDLTALPAYDATFVARTSDELDRQGYSLIADFVAPTDCDAIVDFLGQAGLAFREDLSGTIHQGYTQANVDRASSNVTRIVDQSALLACPAVAKLAFDPNLVAVAQKFLGAPPVHTQTNCWWSKHHSDDLEHVKAAAQQFHQDRDYIRFLKVFIYLTDVDEASGPHEFIAGSNADYAQVSKNRLRSSKRLSDRYLESVYPKDRFRQFTATRGSIILEDTSGFHKGNPVVSGHRLMLQLEYVSSLFGAPGHYLHAGALEHVPPPFRDFRRFVSAYRAGQTT